MAKIEAENHDQNNTKIAVPDYDWRCLKGAKPTA